MILEMLFLVTVVTAGQPADGAAIDEKVILGDWCAGSANAYHEEFSLTIEDGEKRFSSWLHHRPAESGTWTLAGRTLVIHASSGEKYEYQVEQATSDRLLLREGAETAETYLRENCREFIEPRDEEPESH